MRGQEGEGWLHFIPEFWLAVGVQEGEGLYKLSMKAVKQDGQGSGRPSLGLWPAPGMPRGPLLRSQCLSTVYLS